MMIPQFSFLSISIALFTAVSITACSDDNSFSDLGNERNVRFNPKIGTEWNQGKTRAGAEPRLATLTLREGEEPLYLVPTRSSLTGNEEIENLGVFASMKPDGATSLEGLAANYMSNVEVTRANDWAPEARYLLPGDGSLHFNAYSPYVATPGTSGITSLPSPSDTGELSLSFSTPADVADQFDLLLSEPVDSKSSPCDLSFSHALTAIRFATGAEMAPCTVKSISISNVNADGSLNMETGEWSALSTPTTFTVSPDVTLTAADGSKYVATDTYITSEDQTFLLIPQTLSADAEISLTVESGEAETTLTSSLDGIVWTAGKSIVYRLSANPATDSFILELTDSDGNPISSLQSQYTGSTLDYSVKSIHALADGDTVQVAWKAEFIDADGNVIEQPQWISSLPLSGNGSENCNATTVLQAPTFLSMSDDTKTLRNTTDINSTSGMTPYNLSSATGSAAVENTANCYVISAPGEYSIPLVYGNAIKDGAVNTSSYTTTSTNQYALKTFLNHLGNPISDPYIYNNTGCTPASAAIVWEGSLCLVQDVALSADKKFLTFTIPSTYICQGNAQIAVKDGDGNVMWSWQLWVTPYSLDSNVQTVSSNGITVNLLSRNLGQITHGDETLYPAQNVKIRFTQIPDDGSSPLTIDLDIEQEEHEVKTPDCYSFYQWGRKDPMISELKTWYNASHQEIKTFSRQSYDNYTGSLPMISQYIRTPESFWTSASSKAHQYINLWNTDLSLDSNTKTIYDPCPVGFKVTFGKIFNEFVNHGTLRTVSSSEVTQSTGFYISITGSDTEIFFPAYGYLQATTGTEYGYGTFGQVWSAYYGDTKHDKALLTSQRALVFSSNRITFPTDPRAFGFGVRPEKITQ